MTQDQLLRNNLDAKKIADHGRTIAVLMDERPGFDADSARQIALFLREAGYLVHEVTVDEFNGKDLSRLGFLLLIPHAQSVPICMKDALSRFWMQGGQVLLLGGPLFGRLIEKQGDGFVELPLEKSTLDAVHRYGDDFVMEGIAPTHKVYFEKQVGRFLTEPDQCVTGAQLTSHEKETVLCPIARPHGIGFHMEHRNRMITLVQAMGEGGRAEGRRGAAAFLMLSNTRGHLVRTNGTRPGTVSATTPGSCAGGIGLTRQDLLNVEGAGQLLLDMIRQMCRGLYLYEGGAEKFVNAPGETLRLGARIFSLNQDFLPVTVQMRILKDGKEVAVLRRDVLASARAYTEVTFDWNAPETGDYRVITQLLADGAAADTIAQEISVCLPRVGRQEEFVRTQGDQFVCEGKPFYAYGINYWPLFYPSFERPDYWTGWLDKSNYDPLETERDLQQMADMRMNLVCTRMDGDIFGRSMDTLKDFANRCYRHGLKLMLSWANAEDPLFYQPLAVEKFILESGLRDDPVLFCHDISWETGTQCEAYAELYDEGWQDWILDNYGSLENAEKDWGVPADRDEAGRPVHPPREQFQEDGPWRIKVCAFRRYLDEMTAHRWNAAVSHLRSLDPHHMITFRSGPPNRSAGFYFTGTIKHVDFTALEGYAFEQCEEGMGGMVCLSELARTLSGGKPVTWVEYGLSLIGTSGNSPWEALKWDKENLSAYPEMLLSQVEYNGMFFKAFKQANVVGTAPWWYAGGFRRVELSDCGYVSPDGVPRPVWEEYLKVADWFLAPRQTPAADEVIPLDPDATSQSWGRYYLGSGMVDRQQRDLLRVAGKPVDPHPDWGSGALACKKAMAEGKRVAFRHVGEGTTSADMPLLAVGNVPLTGSNPPKYLNAEFNSVTLWVNGKPVALKNHATVTIPRGAQLSLEASAGNLQQAKWMKLNGSDRGSVCLKIAWKGGEIHLPIQADTPYLGDARITGGLSLAGIPEEITLCMEARGISDFGERMHITLIEEA